MTLSIIIANYIIIFIIMIYYTDAYIAEITRQI